LIKRGIYAGLNACSASRALSGTDWRRRRLQILCYHGVSLADEHRWNPALFMHRNVFELRMEFLRRNRYTVLPLAEALPRLYSGDLPARSLVLTFDDGGHDFYAVVAPILARYGYPATVYLTTYYCDYNRPVFRLWCSYMLWKRSGAVIDSPMAASLGIGHKLDLTTAASRDAVLRRLDALVIQNRCSASEKDDLATELAAALEIGSDKTIPGRLLHLMNASEVAELAAQGVDFQLHTHRHRLPRQKGLFVQEVADNRSRIKTYTGKDPAHFCYPSGEFHLEVLPWLAAAGIESATTCEPGIAAPSSDHLLLPRFVDTSTHTQIEFEAWVSGCASLFPSRAVYPPPPRRVALAGAGGALGQPPTHVRTAASTPAEGE